MSVKSIWSPVGDRERLLALGDVDQREREAVARAKQARATRDALNSTGRPCNACAAVGRLTWLNADGTCRRTDTHRAQVSS